MKTARILIVTDGVGAIRKIKIPLDSKVTFGPAIPAPARGNFDGTREYALRVYEGKTEKSGLLAVFTNVREFKDECIEVSKLIVQEEGKQLWKSDEEGYEVVKSVKKTRKLLPDEF